MTALAAADRDRLLSAARLAVSRASRVCRAVQRDLDNIRSMTKDDRSPVTIADFASQAVVAHTLREALGAAPRMVSEEGSATLRQDDHAAHRRAVLDAVRVALPSLTEDDVLGAIDIGDGEPDHEFWTLDPIDGTKGFIRGEQYAVALAYIIGKDPVVAAMGCPNLSLDQSRDFSNPDPRGSMYLAIPGIVYETEADDETAAMRRVDRPGRRDSDPIRACESVESGHSDFDMTAKILDRAGGRGEPARLDSQCKYAVVARGQADAYLRMPTKKGYVEKIWDHAAGALVATASGCVVSDISGKPLNFSLGKQLEENRGIVCAAPGVHQRLIDAIADLT